MAERHGLAAVRHFSSSLIHFSFPFTFLLLSNLLSTPVMSFSSVKCCHCLCLRLLSAAIRCDSTERLRNSLDYLRSVLNDSTSFKLIYRYAFDFARVSLFSRDVCMHDVLLAKRIQFAGKHRVLNAPDCNPSKVSFKPMFWPYLNVLSRSRLFPLFHPEWGKCLSSVLAVYTALIFSSVDPEKQLKQHKSP